MTLILDHATEEILQQELATGQYREPIELIAHALYLVKAERQDSETRRATLIARLEESFAQSERGEGYTPEEARAELAARRAARRQ